MASEMLCVTAPSYTDPAHYQHSKLPRPVVAEPSDVVIKVHAASINPIDVKKAAGMMKAAVKDEFPYQIGYDCAGVVTEIGPQVTKVKVGDEVYVRLPEASRGSWSEYAKCAESFIALKPKSLSFADAASIPLATLTVAQALAKYKGSLAGKTVFVPAGLSGTGAYALQLAKNVLGAGHVITTVSTPKMDQVAQYLGAGVVDQIIDYTKHDPNTVIPAKSVDFILDTTGQAMHFLSRMVPTTGVIVSIATLPSGTQLQASSVMRRSDNPRLPWLGWLALNLMDAVRKRRARRWGVHYEYLFMEPSGEQLKQIARHVDEGKLRPVVGSRVPLQDIDRVREACLQVHRGKGGIGKAVIEV